MGTENKHIDIELLTRYLAAETDLSENKYVEAWVAESTDNQRIFDSLKSTWDTLGTTKISQEIDLAHEWRYHQNLIKNIKPVTRTLNRLFLIRIAASILMLFTLSIVSYRFLASERVSSGSRETRQIVLADGSRITLNAGSKLSYSKSFNAKDRIVNLQGEGYFEVKKNAGKPFIIKLNEAEIEVLGTTFNVKAYKESEIIEVTVTEGRVSLYDSDTEVKKVIASAGEKAEFNKYLKVVKKMRNDEKNYLAWKTKIAYFQNDSLANVVNILESIYHTEIALDNESLYACTLTARFENKDLESVLRILENTLDVTIEAEKDRYVISGTGCK